MKCNVNRELERNEVKEIDVFLLLFCESYLDSIRKVLHSIHSSFSDTHWVINLTIIGNEVFSLFKRIPSLPRKHKWNNLCRRFTPRYHTTS